MKDLGSMFNFLKKKRQHVAATMVIIMKLLWKSSHTRMTTIMSLKKLSMKKTDKMLKNCFKNKITNRL